MGMQDIINILESNKRKWWSVTEMIEILKLRRSSITNSLVRLRKTQYVMFKRKLGNTNCFLYKYKEE